MCLWCWTHLWPFRSSFFRFRMANNEQIIGNYIVFLHSTSFKTKCSSDGLLFIAYSILEKCCAFFFALFLDRVDRLLWFDLCAVFIFWFQIPYWERVMQGLQHSSWDAYHINHNRLRSRRMKKKKTVVPTSAFGILIENKANKLKEMHWKTNMNAFLFSFFPPEGNLWL